ncbi:hypothetical protein MKX01_034595 [Papaver californicum]|nr:hypothetical protein MKX01_034595 [Papaver californicum]
MVADDLFEQIWRNTLSQHRRESKDLLENWGKLAYEDKESVVHHYMCFLYTTIHKDRSESDVKADLRILEDLQTSLQLNIDDGERNYTQYEVALIHALKKIGMVYHKELEKALNMPQDNADCISRGPEMCEFIKKIISKLSRRHLVEPVDDILALAIQALARCGVRVMVIF